MTFDQMRLSYTRSGLAESDLAADPVTQFRHWFTEANSDDKPAWLEVNAMTLATADTAGRVTTRIVLLKAIEDDHFLFFTNYRSEKARQIAANRQVSLGFHWPHLERQVRIVGTATQVARSVSQAYFDSRPRDSRLGAMLSDQSAEISGREVLQTKLDSLQRQFADTDQLPCPDHWGGYAVNPSEVEFWQGRESRLHDRLLYRRHESSWRVCRLSP